MRCIDARLRPHVRIGIIVCSLGIILVLRMYANSLPSSIVLFRDAVVNDPVFALDAPPYQTRQALDQLQSQVTDLTDYYTLAERDQARTAFASLNFLESAVDLAEAREHLRSAPTVLHIITYAAHEYTTLRAHRRAITSVQQSIETLPPSQFVFFDGTTTPMSLARALTHLHDADAARVRILQHRLRCVFIDTASCESIPLPVPMIPAHFSIAASKVQSIAHAVTAIKQSTNGFEKFPTLLAFRNSCNTSETTATMVWFRDDAGQAMRYTFADAIDVIDIEHPNTDARHLMALVSAYAQAGISAIYESSGNAYLCARSAHDIATINRMRLAIETARTLTGSASTSINVHLLSEARVLNNPIVYEYQTAQFAHDVAQLLNSSERNTLSPEIVILLEHMVLGYESGTAYFDEVLRGVMLENDFVSVIHNFGGTMPLSQFVMSRSYPLLFLLGFQHRDSLETTALSYMPDVRMPHSALHYVDADSLGARISDLIATEKIMAEIWNQHR